MHNNLACIVNRITAHHLLYVVDRHTGQMDVMTQHEFHTERHANKRANDIAFVHVIAAMAYSAQVLDVIRRFERAS